MHIESKISMLASFIFVTMTKHENHANSFIYSDLSAGIEIIISNKRSIHIRKDKDTKQTKPTFFA